MLQWSSSRLARGMLPGFVAGLAVGGAGSRLAMRILALTTPSARGSITDFGATVGEISAGGTIFLLLAGSLGGMIAGLAYLALGPLLPGSGWARGLAFGLVLLFAGGGLVVSSDNPDFIRLSPASLAVAMFLVLPVLFGLVFVPLKERTDRIIGGSRHPILLLSLVMVGLLPLALTGGFGLLVIAIAIGVWAARGAIGPQAVRSLRAAGAMLVVGLMAWRGVVLVAEVADILSS